jgi:uncharacterized membrane protein YphA (DoxX/SURF4 family)
VARYLWGMQRRVLDWLGLTSRLVLGVIFLWAGLAKAFDRQGSILSVDAYDVLPGSLARVVGTALPWFEIALGVFLVLGLFVRFAGAGAAVLGVVFIVALSQAKARGLQIDCGCFGAGATGNGVGWFDVLRDVPILAAGVFLAWRPDGPWQFDQVIERREHRWAEA